MAMEPSDAPSSAKLPDGGINPDYKGPTASVPSGGGKIVSYEDGRKRINDALENGRAKIRKAITGEDKSADELLNSKSPVEKIIGDFTSNVAFMALGGAMIVAGMWMLGGGGAIAQDVAKAVGMRNARVTG